MSQPRKSKKTSIEPNSSEIPLPETWNYEDAVTKVEAILSRIESGELELDDVFVEFTTAMKYLHQCETFLKERQAQMDLVIETLTNET